MMNPEDDQSMFESAWEKTWDNFSTYLTRKYGRKTQLKKLLPKTINKKCSVIFNKTPSQYI